MFVGGAVHVDLKYVYVFFCLLLRVHTYMLLCVCKRERESCVGVVLLFGTLPRVFSCADKLRLSSNSVSYLAENRDITQNILDGVSLLKQDLLTQSASQD